MTQHYDQALSPANVTSSQFLSLVGVALLDGGNLGALSELLFQDRSTVTRNIRLLENRQLVTLSQGKDRRSKVVRLTPLGLRTLKKAVPLWETAQGEVEKTFGRQDYARVLKMLSRAQTLNEEE